MSDQEKLEELPTRESTSPARIPHARDHGGPSSTPLFRYLRSRTGQEWNRVFSAVLRHRVFKRLHDVRSRLEYLVNKPSEHRDVHGYWDQLYVDKDGILRFSPRKPQKPWKPKKRFVDMSNDEVASPIKGIWYAFTVEPYKLSEWDSIYEIARRRFQGRLGEVFQRPDTKTLHRIVAKRQLGKKEKKKILA